MLPPTTLGSVHADHFGERQLRRGDEIVFAVQPVAMIQTVDVYPSPFPKRCVWAMLLLSCLLLLHMQQDRYNEVARWRTGGVLDDGQPFPWELQAFTRENDTFEATLLAPIFRRASTFLHSRTDNAMVVTGLTGAPSATNGERDAIFSGAFSLPPLFCGGNDTLPCFAALRPAANSDSSSELECFSFAFGTSAQNLQAPPPGANSGSDAVCLKSKQVSAIVPGHVNGTVVMVWDAPSPKGSNTKQMSCIATLGLWPEIHIGPARVMERAKALLYDRKTSSVAVIGYSAAQMQTLEVYQLDASTLRPRWKYRLPLSVAWLLRDSRVSAGFLVFVGSEETFFGSTFTIDLEGAQVYEQDPPTSSRKPRRRRLPRMMVLEQPEIPDESSHKNVGGDAGDPCAIVVRRTFPSTAVKNFEAPP